MSDEDGRKLLGLAGRAMAPGGQVVSVDTCFAAGQGAISRWMSCNDRGEYVRTPEELSALAGEAFGDVTGEVVHDVTRIPYATG